mmetsp:Transcript_78152/g.155296  ORF Transcript_78152/g.155296 Transcript_78152/m.155296 type:complete len:250 (+) Transcript_78152:672-1421(+)
MRTTGATRPRRRRSAVMHIRQARPAARAPSHTRTTSVQRRTTPSPAARCRATTMPIWRCARTRRQNGTAPRPRCSVGPNPSFQRRPSGTTGARGAPRRGGTVTRPPSPPTSASTTCISPTSVRAVAAATMTPSRRAAGKCVGLTVVPIRRLPSSTRRAARIRKDVAGGDAVSSRQPAFATSVSSTTTWARVVTPRAARCSSLRSISARIRRLYASQSRLRSSSGLQDFSTGSTQCRATSTRTAGSTWTS